MAPGQAHKNVNQPDDFTNHATKAGKNRLKTTVNFQTCGVKNRLYTPLKNEKRALMESPLLLKNRLDQYPLPSIIALVIVKQSNAVSSTCMTRSTLSPRSRRWIRLATYGPCRGLHSTFSAIFPARQ